MQQAEGTYLNWIAAELSGNARPEQTARLQAWRQEDPQNEAFFQEMQTLWDASLDEAPFPVKTDRAWAQLESRLDRLPKNGFPQEPVRKTGWQGPRRIWIAAAVAFLLGFALWWVVQPEPPVPALAETIRVSSPANERQRVELPDGSVVWLNEGSELSWKDDFTVRTVQLSGEGLFEVAHDPESPFTVSSGPARTRVLGTIFNVSAYRDQPEIEVSVLSGKVEVSVAEEQAPVLLEKGQVATVDRSRLSLEKRNANVQNAAAWKEQALVFDNVSLREAARDLEEFFDLEIRLQTAEVGNCPVRHPRVANPDFQTLLANLVMVSGQQFRQIDERTWLIYGPGCN